MDQVALANPGPRACSGTEFTYALSHAYERITGNDDLFEAQEQQYPRQPGEFDLGEDFDFDDSAEMHRRLPRLAALFLNPSE
ncbi:hypothetical protein AB0K48_01880 [Nonomuraea sp. NPDC055795]